MALEWIRENIHNFNGDRNYVTIFGENAGGNYIQYSVTLVVFFMKIQLYAY